MRPEDTQACMDAERDVDAEKKELPDTIYLIPESSGEFGEYWSWCDTPTPTDSHTEGEAVKYVRADL